MKEAFTDAGYAISQLVALEISELRAEATWPRSRVYPGLAGQASELEARRAAERLTDRHPCDPGEVNNGQYRSIRPAHLQRYQVVANALPGSGQAICCPLRQPWPHPQGADGRPPFHR